MPAFSRHIFTVLALLFVSAVAVSQPLVQQHAAVTGANTYAIVIGIANYEFPEIPKLSFPGRDAVVFADFLKSAPGGSVPKENIKLLTDSTATIGEVDKALRWLVASCKEGDKVFFYFSGHGEMENVTMSKNGYLICFNTPPTAFVNMGLSIDYLNDVVNTLSAQTKATVIVITDACHSGKMSENKFKGNLFVGEQLMLKKQNEIRMASCKATELSNEKEDWGGGRGVFSYYLVNALQGGLADLNHDNSVSVGELKNYMEASMAGDPVLKKEGDIQTPVIDGNPNFELAPVIQSEAVKVKEQVKNDSLATVMVMSSMPSPEDNTTPDEYFFNRLKSESPEVLTDSLKLNEVSANDIPFIIIRHLLKKTPPKQNDQLISLQNELKADAEKLNRFNLDIASTFLDAGQVVIANYLRGDEAELERRRYYNSKNNGYDVYTRMFSIAAKLSQSDRYYSTRAQVFFHYFSGLALRIKIPLTEKQDSLIEAALQHQKAALNLEDHAAYIYNELGVLMQYKKKYDEAEKYYDTASLLSPGWAIPKSNLCGLYTVKKQYSKALAYADSADALQKNLQSVSVNRGLINEKQHNYLFAEEDYHNAIDINSRHYAPFERLGFVNLNTANYALADSFFYEADLRKRGYHFKGNGWGDIEANTPIIPLGFSPCMVDSSILEPTDVFAFFTWGVQEYYLKRYSNAIRILRKVVAVEATNPLVYHYMGKAYYDEQKWEEASLMFRLAENNSKDPGEFNAYVDSVVHSKKYRYDHTCFEDFFRYRYYGQVEDYYFSGTIHENWKHFEEAEKYFRKITSMSVRNNTDNEGSNIKGQIEIQEYEKTPAYAKLWHLFERLGRYNESENEIKNFGTIDSRSADEELNEFYRRMIERFPDNGDWYYRLGTLLYKYAPLTNRVKYFDSIVRFPFLNKEMFIDFELYPRLLYGNDSLSIYDETEIGESRNIVIREGQLHVDKRNFKIPGTGENVPGAGLIYMPRKDGITYLQKAAELISEKEALADIHFKTGNIYVWAGSKKMAYPYFEKSLSLVPDNANARLTLVDIYNTLHKNRAAYSQLNYLCDSNQINLEKRILFARFNIYKGDFVKAGQLLQIAEGYTTYTIPEINNQRGLALTLADKPKQAIEFYKKNITEQETDNQFNFYSLARLYAKIANQKEAWKYLQFAVDAGFNYSYVFQNDSYLDDLRKTSKWQSFIAGISMKTYRHKIPKK